MGEIVGAVSGFGAFAGLALVSTMFWRLYNEVRKERDYWRAKALRYTDIADEFSQASVELVKAGKADEDDEVHERLGRVINLLLERTKREGEEGVQ